MAAKKSGDTNRGPGETVDELRARADEFQSIFDNSALGIFQSSIEGRFLRVNSAFAHILGYESSRELIDSIQDIHKQFYLQPERRHEIMAAVEAEDGLSRFETELQRKDGSVITASLKIRAVRNDRGDVSHLDGFIEDVTVARERERVIKEQSDYLSKENIRLRASIKDRYRFGGLIGKSGVMQEVYERMTQAAATDVSVIITGESGTGKELVAKAIHGLSRRQQGEFVTVNCGAIPENLLESEFFGHKKGAFTGANADTHGYLDLANGGTLFLDEVGELGPEMQVKLLRAVEGGGYFPVGDSRMRQSNFRVIAATNRNLREMVKAGRMREDFFFRIHIIPISMPSLRDRRDDIPLLVDQFLHDFAGSDKPLVLPGKVLEALYRYDWPGNIRELQNVLRRYLAIKRLDFIEPSGSTMTEETSSDAPANSELPLHQMVAQYEKGLIEKCLEHHHWHRGRTAAVLQIDRKTLFIKMKAHGLI